MLQATNQSEGFSSDVRPAADPVRSMSERFWGLDWGKVMPWTVGEFIIEPGSFEEVIPFVREHQERLFGPTDKRFLVEEMTEARRRFWAESDVHLFRHQGRLIGYHGAHPSDWSTYYCRSISILPEFRESGLATQYAIRLCEALAKAGVARIDVDTSPANVAMQRTFLGAGFVVTAMINSERWGTSLRYTKMLNQDAAAVFKQQFIYVPEFGRNPKPNRRGP